MNGFSDKIISWFRNNARDLPWRKTNDPYKIWLSEIILQQTRVEQGRPYYLKFIEEFPTLSALSKATENKVLKIWQGLGYYSRARNLLGAAKKMTLDCGPGGFPDSYEKLIKYKGIGAYTAAAVSSIAFGERRAVVDGNVYRVLARVYGITEGIDTGKGKKVFQKIADQLMPKTNTGDYNQGLMEFGSLVCTPKNPSCATCVFVDVCYATREKKVAHLPVKEKKTLKKKRFFIYFDVFFNNKRLIKKREVIKDIWKGLYDFPVFEAAGPPLSRSQIKKYFASIIDLPKSCLPVSFEKTKYLKHILTHQEVNAYFIRVHINVLPRGLMKKYKLVSERQLNKYPFPRLFENYFREA